MGKKKPLTKYENHLTKYIQNDKIHNYDFENREWISRERLPSEWRKLIKSRLQTDNAAKITRARTALVAMYNAMKGNDYNELENAFYLMKSAMKFQGYLQMQIAFGELKGMESKDEELRNAIIGEVAKSKLVLKSSINSRMR